MAQTDVSGIAQAAASIANAQNSTSTSSGSSWEQNMGQSTMDAVSDSSAWSQNDEWSQAEGISDAWAEAFGAEASAQDIINALTANEQQEKLYRMQEAYNREEATKNREFQREMSNTAYQRAVKDLIKAGLNPILAVGNMGASTPQGSQASSGLASAAKANAYMGSKSGSSAYNYSRSEGHGRSESESHSEQHSQSTSSGAGGSSNESQSETTTQLKELSDIIQNLTNANSNSGKTVKPYTGNKPSGGVTKSPRQLEEQIAADRKRR